MNNFANDWKDDMRLDQHLFSLDDIFPVQLQKHNTFFLQMTSFMSDFKSFNKKLDI